MPLKPGAVAAKDMADRQWAEWCRQQFAAPRITDNYPDDATAAAAGIKLGEMYHTNGTVKVRLT